MIDDILDVLRSPNGRSNRTAFWSCVVIFIVATFVYEIILGLVLGHAPVPLGQRMTVGFAINLSADNAYLTVPVLPFGEPSGLIEAILGQLSAGVIVLLIPLWVLQLTFATTVIVRRLHDRDKDWWWFLVWVLVPFLLNLVATLLSGISNIGMIGPGLLAILGISVSLWGYAELGVPPGTPGTNRFGAPPRSQRAAAEIFD